MALAYRTSPSLQMDLTDDPYTAYCFDEAAYTWGLHVQNEVDAAGAESKDNKAKAAAKQRRLMSILGQSDKPLPGTFRDPASGM